MLAKLQNNAGPNYILGLAPAAWFRNGQGIAVAGLGVSQWDDQSGNARHLLQGTDANRPLNIPFTGEKYVWNGNVAANTLTAPTTAITGNVTIAFDATQIDYTPAGDITLFSKLSGNNGLAFLLLTTGVLRVRIGDGAAVTNVDSNASIGSTDNTRVSLRVDWTDGVGASFSANGSAVGTAVAAVKTLTNAATDATIGPWNGSLYRCVVTNGGATSYYDAYPTSAADGAATFTGGVSETWTVNSTGSKPAQIVGRSSILFDGAAHFLKCSAFTLNQPETVYLLFKQVSWASNDFVYDGEGLNVGALAQNNGGDSPQLVVNAGSSSAPNYNLAIGSYGVSYAVYNGASGVFGINNTTALTGNYGAQNMGGFTLGKRGDATASNYSNIQVLECLIFGAAHDAATRARVISYLAGVGSLAL